MKRESDYVYRVEMKTADGQRLLDPSVFLTRKGAEMRIAAFLNREGCRIVKQKAEGICKSQIAPQA